MEKPLNEYQSMNDFFIRKLKPGSRPIDDEALVSPCDSRVMSFGFANEMILSVKGSAYSLVQLLKGETRTTFKELKASLSSNPDNDLYYITLYLAPGDYHRFHAPTDWKVKSRRHIFGYMQGVFAWNLSRKNDVFATNERVVYTGEWKYGKIAYVPVAAFNVGDIKVGCDPFLVTNLTELGEKGFEDRDVNRMVSKGEEFGMFNAGSTIIMVFEAPKFLKWAVTEEQKLKVGNKLVELV